MSLGCGNLFEQLPADLKEEAFDKLLENGQLKVERIVSKGHCSPPDFWYDQEQDEWVLLLKGAAIVRVDGEGDHHLEPGSFLKLPAHKRHRVQWTSPDTETIWLAIHYVAGRLIKA
ncbi:MAG: cupin domain-containing protein [Gammaproteobacteria bacterium]|nr:cupin domain-containing protein [Gammaproteobacteria bacterium]